MPNAFYEAAGEGFALSQINWVKDDFRVVLINRKLYTPNLKKHAFLSDVPKAARVAVSDPLRGKRVEGFACDAEDVTLERVVGPLCEGAILVQWKLMERDSRLLLWMDEAEFLPFLPNGGDLEIEWPNGPTKLFRF